MSHQLSIVHQFLPLNGWVLEKKFLRKSCSISENLHKTALENINFAHTKYLWVIKGQLYVIFPLLMYKSWRTIFKGKVVPLVKTNTDCKKNINFAHTKYLWVIKGQLYVIVFLLMYKSWRNFLNKKLFN